MKKLILVIIVLVVLLLVFFGARSATPVVELSSAVTTLGQATPITVHVRDPRGIRSVQAFVEQNGDSVPGLCDGATVEVRQTTPGTSPPASRLLRSLQAGKAKLIVEATSNDLLQKDGSR